MAIVKILIKGISMVYHKEDSLWKILFPIGECHEVKFKDDSNEAEIPLAKEGRQIHVTTENASSSFEIADNYSNILDLTAEYSHIDGVRLKDDWSENAVLMSIENAEMSVYEYTETAHMMTKNENVTLAPQQIGYSAQAIIVSDQVTVNVDDHPDFPKTFSSDCTIIFDNDCELGATREVSDFDLVYNVIEDINAAKERFVVTKVPENLDYPIFVGSKINLANNEDFKDPFARGLPCHLVKISKSEELI